MTLLAKNIPKHGRELIGLEAETHIAGPPDNKILRLAQLRDARKISFDIGCKYRDACARKSLGHYLQRDRFPGSRCAGDEAMTIGKSKRQPCRLLSLADENLVASINRLDFGFRHPIAFALVARSLRNYTISRRTIEPGQRPSHEAETHFAAPQS